MNRLTPPFSTCLALIFLTPVHADLTYVDATDGNSGNTTLSNGSTLNADDTTGGTTWRQRENVGFGSSGTIFEGIAPSPELKTKITGLAAGERYDVYVHFFDKTGSTVESWSVRAGFTGSNLINFKHTNDTIAGATDAVTASSLTYDTPPDLFIGTGEMLAGFVGTTPANASGEIEVFIDDFGSADVNLRAWYDGLSYQLSTAPPPDPSLVSYLDATVENTSRWDGLVFSPAAQGNTSIDNNWEARTLGSSGSVFESNADGPENAPLLVTTITGLQPSTEYVLYAYFWHDGRNWRLKASSNLADIQDNGTQTNASDDFLPTSPLINFSSVSNADNTATIAPRADSNSFSNAPLFTEGNRTLRQASLGTAFSDTNGNLPVYIDDLAQVTEGDRTWYDGVGYKIAIELDPSGDEDGDGLTNGEEETAGTSPYLVDTDGDGYTDKIETDAGFDPLDSNSFPPSPPAPGNGLEIAPDGAWTWFNDERAIFHQGSLYSGYVKGNGQYGITRYDPTTNQSFHTVISTGSSQQQDDHNNPSITVLPDGRLMILYAKHLGGSQFYQRTSLITQPSDLADWGPEVIHALPANNTYNNTYQLSAESNRIYNFHRCINFNPTITVSNDSGSTWETSIPFIEVGGGNVRPYPRYCSNHTDRIDLIYTDGHPRDVNNSVYHLYYANGSFRRTGGEFVDSFDNLPLDHQGGQRGSVIYQYSSAAWGPGDGPDDWIPSGRGWTWDVHYGSDGNPVCAFQVQRDNVTGDGWNHDRIYYYYARWTGATWEKKFIAQAGRGLYPGEDDYGGGMTIDPSNPNVVYLSSNAASPFALDDIENVPLAANERYEIYRGVTTDGGQTFAWEQITVNSEKDNMRPIVPENHSYDRALLWFNGTYTTYTNYDCRILALLENEISLETSMIDSTSATLQWVSSPGRSYKIGGSTDLENFPIVIESGIISQGLSTSHSFTFPAPLAGAVRGFFRVEEE